MSGMQLKKSTKMLLVPLILTGAIFICDQITKTIVAHFVEPYYAQGYAISVIGDFARIIHTTNDAIAFSIGRNFSPLVKRLLFTALPILLLGGMYLYYFRASLTRLQRWSLAAMLGGGMGNLFDRIARPDGVVDFIDIKFYGIFGFERWPTFNVADSSIVIGAIILVCATLFDFRANPKAENDAPLEHDAQLEHEATDE